MSYSGPDRRRHRVFVTRHTEYHMRDRHCVAVRDKTSGDWQATHVAVGQELVGVLFLEPKKPILHADATEPPLGWRLCFANDTVTSPLCAVERPPREIVARYAA